MNIKLTEKKDIIKKHKLLSGIVMSDKMKDTVVVAVSRYKKHKKYGKTGKIPVKRKWCLKFKI